MVIKIMKLQNYIIFCYSAPDSHELKQKFDGKNLALKYQNQIILLINYIVIQIMKLQNYVILLFGARFS